MGTKKLPVALHLLPSLDFIELVQYNEKSGEIDKASALPCKYDLASRLMVDRDAIAQTIKDLYNLHRVPFSTPAVLVLPSFFTREFEVPGEVTTEELRFVLVSEAERSYLFKKVEPQLDWTALPNDRVLYSAFPQHEIEKYLKIFQELKIPLVAIELNYFSALRGLVATGSISEVLESELPWCMIYLADNAIFCGLYQSGTLQQMTDIPLSLNTDNDPLADLSEITGDLESFLSEVPLSRLVIINNSKQVQTEDLMTLLSFTNSTDLLFVEQNAATTRSLGASDAPYPCTLEGIGGVFYQTLTGFPRLNFNIQSGPALAEVLSARSLLLKILIGLCALCVASSLFLWGVLSLIEWNKSQSIQNMFRSQTNPTQLDAAHIDDVQRKKFIRQNLVKNVQLNNFLVKFGIAIPKDVWLENMEITNAIKESEQLSVKVDGKALNLSTVDAIPAQMIKDFPQVKLQVSSAEPLTSEEGQTYFQWTIQNQQEAAPQSASPVTPGVSNASH